MHVRRAITITYTLHLRARMLARENFLDSEQHFLAHNNTVLAGISRREKVLERTLFFDGGSLRCTDISLVGTSHHATSGFYFRLLVCLCLPVHVHVHLFPWNFS